MEPEQTPKEPRPLLLPEYGLGGDQAGARRARRAFRFGVLACVVFSAGLWHADRYLRYDLTEAQYRMALTLETDSARAILRNVVKRDSEKNEVPNPKYVEALAAIEEDDVVLARYAEAYKLNTGNPSLIINYGCRLFMSGQFKEARERFRESSVLPPKNALPRYLEAAALAAGSSKNEDLSEAIALVARTNNSGDPVIFPQPLWHSSLPQRGAWYARTRREIVDRCCAPLYRFRSQVVNSAKAEIDSGQVRDWASWLGAFQVMGERLVGNASSEGTNLGAPQAIAGVQIQLDAVRLLNRVRELVDGSPDSTLIARSVKLEDALQKLKDFEAVRDGEMSAHRGLLRLPLHLCGITFLVFSSFYGLALLFYRMRRAGRACWTLPHPLWVKGILGSGLGLLLGELFVLMALNDHAQAGLWAPFARVLWFGPMTAMVLVGFLYPEVVLPRAGQVIKRHPAPEVSGVTLAMVNRCRRMAYVSLIRRYFGILLGGFLCILCVWFIGYRILISLYPYQLPLLVTGLEAQELAVVRHVQGLLAAVGGIS